MTQPRLPRILPLTRVRLRDEDAAPISVEDLFEELTCYDKGTYKLERGEILFRQRGEARAYATRSSGGRVSAFRVLADTEAQNWIERMISPITTARAWRLKIAIHKLRAARREVDLADSKLDALVSHDHTMMAGRAAPKAWKAAFEKKIRRAGDDLRLCLRSEAHAIWLIRYLLRQRAHIRCARGVQLQLPFQNS